MRTRTLGFAAGLWLALAAACVCVAADFSADMYMSGRGAKTPMKMGRVYAGDKMMRFETSMGGVSQVTIMRLDKKTLWMLNPAKKQYMEMPIPQGAPADPRSDAAFARNATVKKLGSETVSGFACDKTQYVPKRLYNPKAGTSMKPGKGVKITRWFCKKLNFPIKTQSVMPGGTMVQEMRNVKLGRQPMSLFELPKGYKKTSMQSGMPGMGGRMHGGPGPAKPKK